MTKGLVHLKNLFCYTYIFFPEILVTPEDTVVFLNQSAVFTCETDDGIPAWRINGTVLNDLPPEIHDDIEVVVTHTAEGTTVEELTIPGRVGYNGTRAQCLALIFGGSTAESETVTMRIQGTSILVQNFTIKPFLYRSTISCY